MTLHMVKLDDLEACRLRVDAKVNSIMEELVAMNANVENTFFVGENAEAFATQMNVQVDAFVATQRLNLDELLRSVTANMNVVVTKLGGQAWPPPNPIDITNAQKAVAQKGAGYGIETTDMESLQREIRRHLQQISNYYNTIGPEAIGESEWVGPEKEATVAMVSSQVQAVILPDIETTASDLALALAQQVAAMEASAPSSVW